MVWGQNLAEHRLNTDPKNTGQTSCKYLFIFSMSVPKPQSAHEWALELVSGVDFVPGAPRRRKSNAYVATAVAADAKLPQVVYVATAVAADAAVAAVAADVPPVPAVGAGATSAAWASAPSPPFFLSFFSFFSFFVSVASSASMRATMAADKLCIILALASNRFDKIGVDIFRGLRLGSR
jgi:hypothetical protein